MYTRNKIRHVQRPRSQRISRAIQGAFWHTVMPLAGAFVAFRMVIPAFVSAPSDLSVAAGFGLLIAVPALITMYVVRKTIPAIQNLIEEIRYA